MPCQCYLVTEQTREQKWLTWTPGKQTTARSNRRTEPCYGHCLSLGTQPRRIANSPLTSSGQNGTKAPHICVCSAIWLFVTPWAIARQAPLSMGFSRQEYRSGLPCPPPGDLPDPGIEPESFTPPALEGGFFTSSATWEASFTIPPLIPLLRKSISRDNSGGKNCLE